MDKQSLIGLSDSTFFDNDQGLITPGSHREFNKELINYFDSARPATYIVDSDAALSAWANVAAGNDYSHVLIKPGIYNIDKTINLLSSNTHTVIGMAGSCIISSATIGIKGSLETRDNLLIGVKIKGELVAYEQCINLIHCTGETSENPAFRNCTNLINCNGFRGGAAGGMVYDMCEHLTNCYAYCSLSGTSQAYGYNACIFLTNCYAKIKNEGVAYGFYSCNNMANCVGTAESPNKGGAGFSMCTILTGCCGMGIGVSGYGFFRCRTLFGCGPYGSSTSNTYKDCYMSKGGTTNPVGDSALGGYNW